MSEQKDSNEEINKQFKSVFPNIGGMLGGQGSLGNMSMSDIARIISGVYNPTQTNIVARKLKGDTLPTYRIRQTGQLFGRCKWYAEKKLTFDTGSSEWVSANEHAWTRRGLMRKLRRLQHCEEYNV